MGPKLLHSSLFSRSTFSSPYFLARGWNIVGADEDAVLMLTKIEISFSIAAIVETRAECGVSRRAS